ncbi:MAG: phosphate acyltransferase PlsX [Clostridiales bacterium]|nr:phosphate acyltransferase PlsX [Clostridiales bacterium]
MKIVVDAYGGDNAPKAIIEGAIAALNRNNIKDFTIVLTGKSQEIEKILKEYNYTGDEIEIVDANQVITNDDSPTDAIRQKRDSSLVKAFDYLNTNSDAMALVSAGSTGAVLTGGVLLLKRIRGIQRPALSPILPTLTGGNVMLIDCGANVEPKARNLVEFAQMGAVYMQKVYNIDNPRIALLSNGTEDSKGNTLNKEVFPLLKESQLNFIGNMEAREILSGDYDVVVADGFSGNIALKACEGTALSMFSLIKKGIMSGSLRAKLGYLLLKPVLKDIKKTLDYNDNGGAVLLGLEKVLVKSHGSSKAKAICNSILQARDLVASGVLEKLKEEFTVAK